MKRLSLAAFVFGTVVVLSACGGAAPTDPGVEVETQGTPTTGGDDLGTLELGELETQSSAVQTCFGSYWSSYGYYAGKNYLYNLAYSKCASMGAYPAYRYTSCSGYNCLYIQYSCCRR